MATSPVFLPGIQVRGVTKGQMRLSTHPHTHIWNTVTGVARKMELRRQFRIRLCKFKMSKWQVKKLLFLLKITMKTKTILLFAANKLSNKHCQRSKNQKKTSIGGVRSELKRKILEKQK